MASGIVAGQAVAGSEVIERFRFGPQVGVGHNGANDRFRSHDAETFAEQGRSFVKKEVLKEMLGMDEVEVTVGEFQRVIVFPEPRDDSPAPDIGELLLVSEMHPPGSQEYFGNGRGQLHDASDAELKAIHSRTSSSAVNTSSTDWSMHGGAGRRQAMRAGHCPGPDCPV